MTVVALLVAIAVFIAILRASGVVDVASRAIATARGAAVTMSARDLSDTDKERLIRLASGRLFGDFLRIFGISAVALAAPAAILWLGALIGLYGLDRVGEIGTSWLFILAASVAATVLWLVLDRRGRGRA